MYQWIEKEWISSRQAVGLTQWVISCEGDFWYSLSPCSACETRALLSSAGTGSYLGLCWKMLPLPLFLDLTHSEPLNEMYYWEYRHHFVVILMRRQHYNLFGYSCRPPVGKVKLGRDPTVLCINAFFVLLFDFSSPSPYLSQLRTREAYFKTFCPFKASSDWKDSWIWKAIITPQMQRERERRRRGGRPVSEFSFLFSFGLLFFG